VAAITLDGIRKSYGRGPEVVRGVDLQIADGELVTLVGPSGCGKSTLLALIAGLERPTAGAIRFDGRDVTDEPPRRRDVAMVFQSYALYPHLSVRRNLAFPLEVAGVARAEIARRVAATAERLGLAALLDRRPRELSGGQRQRVALGRALVREPRAYLFDEPLSNLDVALRAEVRAELKRLHERLRATFIYVTHDQAEAMTLSDRVVVLHDGVVQQVAPPRALYARPANTFVARFIGSPPINLVEPRGPFAAAPSGVLVGVRPENVTVGAGAPPAGAHAGRVYLTEPMGAETWVTVESDGLLLTGRAPGDFAVGSGDPVWFAFAPEALLRFDARSGRAVDESR
jgi:multiple sugar transport system ATP-binding protein